MDLSSVQPTYSTLPEDIMFEILYRLPVKSLLRFRKTKRLPEPEISIKDEYGLNPIFGVSFGYYGDDYKVIAIAYVDNTYIVSIYSLSTNSWKIISTSFDLEEDDNEDNDIGLFVLATKFVDGTAYMVTSRRVIVYFELNHETIGAIKFPEEFHAIGITMEVYEETIAVLGHANNYLSMWILRDKSFSSTSSWEKKFSVRLQEPGHHQAVGFLNNGKYLIRTFNFAGDSGTETKLILCDLECPKMTEFRSLVEFCSSSRRRLPPKYPTYHGRIHSSCMESFLLLNEDSVHPFVKTEIESSCSSILLTLQWDATLNAL